MMEMIRIPEERVGELIGEEGKNKKRIEEHFDVKISVKDEGEVTIEGEGADAFFAKDVVHAIGRGFKMGEAVKLFKDNYLFHVIDLRDQFNTDNARKRMKGRVIGEKGKIKTEIEQSTDADLCIYGHTVAIIAPAEMMEFAKEAVFKILDGAPHTTVLNYLKKVRGVKLAIKLKG
ncbi:RNA-processing protein [Candidatus Micrarchaeota archaeon]|nr:RNA-processing protein [Candidatus Micrarchaeota archaeon]MBD3418004.1 RNA-processing protein [Candidatus Micrarchaeota archaeon]